MKKLSLLLVDDHTIVRQGLLELLKLDPSIDVIGEAQDGHQAVILAEQLQPDVILMDIAMPILNGLEATRQILKTNPDAKILILTAHVDDEYVQRAIEVGAAGYLLKHTSATTLYRSIHELKDDQILRRPTGGNPKRRPSQPITARFARLTPREAEVLQLIAEGHANKQTAQILDISIKTVEKHREHVMSKLDIHDTAGLTRYAIGAGIIESGNQPTIT
ncbi:MAG: DNA-binding response regulator [Planctomycetota bacterium]|nr:MAG: DNA-binding response regulator [Planctomycetota bacterium]